MTPLPQLDPNALRDFHEDLLDHVSNACGLNEAERARLISAKQCLACGAYQDIHGVLPCGHDHDL